MTFGELGIAFLQLLAWIIEAMSFRNLICNYHIFYGGQGKFECYVASQWSFANLYVGQTLFAILAWFVVIIFVFAFFSKDENF